MIERADVYKDRILAGALWREAGGTMFAYRADYLASGLPAIASTLPRSPEATFSAAGAVPPFFAGLLPEGRRLSALRRSIKSSADDELSLLVAIGADTVGDTQVVPADEPVPIVEPMVELPPSLADIRFSELVSESSPVDRVGLPGAQDKVSGKMIAVPAARASARYILKLNPPEYPGVVENEAYFISVARACGIPVAEARVIHDAEGASGLLVSRFDRLPARDGVPRLLAVEDACQALGRWPADKYAPTMESAVGALAALTSAPVVAARDAFRQVVFALLTGNGDLHAKNIAVLADVKGEYRLSPAYDLPSTAFYGDRTLALSIRGKRAGISRRLLLEFAEEIGLRRAAAERSLDALLARTENMIAGLAVLPFPRSDTIKVVRELSYRRRLLTAQVDGRRPRQGATDADAAGRTQPTA